MIKIIYVQFSVFLFSILIYFSGSGQVAYISAGLGYNFPASQQVLGSTIVGSVDEVVQGSFGKGVSYGATGGYMLNENIAAELSLSILSGSDYTFSDTFNITEKVSGSMLRFTPALKFTAGNLVKPYAKVGLVIGVTPAIEDDYTGFTNAGSNFVTITGVDKYTGNSSIGYMGALGFENFLAGNFSFFIEAIFFNQTYSPAVDNYSYSANVNGSVLNRSGTINFVNIVTNNPSGQQIVKAKNYLPFGSIGFNAGVKLNFGHKIGTKIQKSK